MIGRYAPPLNLSKCPLPRRRRYWMISRARKSVLAKLGSGASTLSQGTRDRQPVTKVFQPELPAGDVDTAEAIARRYGLESEELPTAAACVDLVVPQAPGLDVRSEQSAVAGYDQSRRNDEMIVQRRALNPS